MSADYGYSDGSGGFFITIDTDRCNGCADCVQACPSRLFQVLDEDPNDPLSEKPVVIIVPDKKNKIKYECGSCKPSSGRPPLPCVAACKQDAVSHSW